MSGEQYDENRIQPHAFDRRSFLHASVGSGIVSTVGLTGSATAQEMSGGELLWEFETSGVVSSSPTVVNNSVFVCSWGRLHKLDAETGDSQWSFQVEGGANSSPNVVNGTVYIGWGTGQNENESLVESTGVYALDAGTGEELWHFGTDVQIQSSPTVKNGTVYIGSGSHLDSENTRLYALNAETGDERWTFETDNEVGSPTVIDDAIFIGSRDGRVYALDAETGDERWTFETLAGVLLPPTVAGDLVFIKGISSIYALNIDTGEEHWSRRLDGSDSSPTVANETVFVGSEDTIHALDVATGDVQWESELDGQVSSAPTVADGAVYIGCNENKLYNLDASTGDRQWSFDAGAPVSSPIVVDGTVFFGNGGTAQNTTRVFALDAGVEGSSEGSRVMLGTTGHHHVWAGKESERDASTPTTTVFQQITGTARPRLLWALAGLGTGGGAYAGYKKLSGTDDSIDSDAPPANDRSVDAVEDSDLTITEYDEIQIGGTIRESLNYQLQQGQIGDHHFWVLKPSLGDAETVSTTVFETFSEGVDPWAGMDSHPHLVNLLGTGSEPIPWAAIEDADDSTLVEQVDRLSMNETIEALEEVCEALHHVHRYGTEYENLTTDSVLYVGEGTVTLRGVLDAFDEPDPWYNAPEEFDDESTERSTVYRIGLITYELFTGRLPYEVHPDGDPKEGIESEEIRNALISTERLPPELTDELVKALSKNPADRHETVLHLRDSFSEIVSE